MKLILHFLRPYRRLCLFTILVMLLDVAGGLLVPRLTADMINIGVESTAFFVINIAIVAILWIGGDRIGAGFMEIGDITALTERLHARKTQDWKPPALQCQLPISRCG